MLDEHRVGAGMGASWVYSARVEAVWLVDRWAFWGEAGGDSGYRCLGPVRDTRSFTCPFAADGWGVWVSVSM